MWRNYVTKKLFIFFFWVKKVAVCLHFHVRILIIWALCSKAPIIQLPKISMTKENVIVFCQIGDTMAPLWNEVKSSARFYNSTLFFEFLLISRKKILNLQHENDFMEKLQGIFVKKLLILCYLISRNILIKSWFLLEI